MRYIKLQNGLPVEVSNKYPDEFSPVKDGKNGWISTRDFNSLQEAETMAKYVTAFTGEIYLASDDGPKVFPRWEIFKAPRVGEEVSRGFNGDYYSCGKIVSITKGWRVTTDSGARFNRVKQTGSWKEIGGSFFMVPGIINELNPHF